MSEKMKNYILVIALALTACTPLPQGVEESLKIAGGNKWELRKALRHYRKHEADSLKYKAALFLIDNMKWHGNDSEVKFPDATIPGLVERADTFYYSVMGDVPNSSINKKEIKDKIAAFGKAYQAEIGQTNIKPPYREKTDFDDLKNIDADFLISHIDNAFERWEKSPFARTLTFEDFCEYLLPYRALSTNSLTLNGADIYRQFGKQLDKAKPYSMATVITRYNVYMNNMRNILGEKTVGGYLGYYELFFKKKLECVEQCEMECNILRAYGVPTVIDINVGNREFVGQHHHIVTFDSLMNPHPFHGEAGFPGGKSWGYREDIKFNIYRSLFGAQEDSPLFLKKETEKLPVNFYDPCIRDVTSYIKRVYPLTLPLSHKTGNNLAWLYSYANNPEGIRAITWGTVDSTGTQAHFKNVVSDMLYFLVTLDAEGRPEFHGEPLYIPRNPEAIDLLVYPLSHFYTPAQGEKTDIRLIRKFPYKENMKKLAQEMVGGKFYGSNDPEGKNKRELYTITEAPGPYLNEFPLDNRRAWKYYIYEAPEKRTANFSILEYLTEKSRKYENTASPTPLEIFRPEDRRINTADYVKVLPKNAAQLKDPEYDGDMQTSSGKKRIVFELDTPQILTRVRMAPKNADNIVKPNENYELMVWEDGWQSLSNQDSKYNYLDYKDLRTDRLYWLRNHSRGREEVPFIIRNGEPQFVYYDVMQAIEYEDYIRLDRTGWSCTASSEEPDSGPYEPGYARFAIDDDLQTFWHSRYTGETFKYPHWLEIDMKKKNRIDGFFVRPRGRDIPKNIEFAVSDDGENWTQAGNFALYNEGSTQEFMLKEPQECRFFRITLKNGFGTAPHTSIVEIGALKNKY
ncbi:MAG: discoidin domain-containing protein [Odoribacter splanchnicus]|nr:discoidin domain-containing protein [Odoribacter splanchnicus]